MLHSSLPLPLSSKGILSVVNVLRFPPPPLLFFQESVLNYRFDPLGIVDGFTAEVGASGVFCPTHMTLPVEVSFYSVSDDNAPSPYMVNH